jgi:hypothetical protein
MKTRWRVSCALGLACGYVNAAVWCLNWFFGGLARSAYWMIRWKKRREIIERARARGWI